MTTNESFFFRDKIPFDHFRDAIMPGLIAARAQGAAHPHLVRGGLHRPGALFARDVLEGDEGASLAAGASRFSPPTSRREVLEKAKAGVYSQFEVQRGLPIQLLVKYFTPGRRHLADRARHPRHGAVPAAQSAARISPASARFDVVFCRNVLIYFDQETKIGVLNRIAQGARRPTAIWCSARPKRWWA